MYFKNNGLENGSMKQYAHGMYNIYDCLSISIVLLQLHIDPIFAILRSPVAQW